MILQQLPNSQFAVFNAGRCNILKTEGDLFEESELCSLPGNERWMSAEGERTEKRINDSWACLTHLHTRKEFFHIVNDNQITFLPDFLERFKKKKKKTHLMHVRRKFSSAWNSSIEMKRETSEQLWVSLRSWKLCMMCRLSSPTQWKGFHNTE